MTAGGGAGGADGKGGKPPVADHDEAMFRPASELGFSDAVKAEPAKAEPAKPPTSSNTPRVSFPAYVPSGSASAPAGAPPSTSPTRPATSPGITTTSTRPATSPGTSAKPTTSAAAKSAGTGPDDPSLPTTPDTYDENELRAAIGASPRKSDKKQPADAIATDDASTTTTDDDDRDDATPRRRGPRAVLVAVLLALGAVGAGVIALVGYLNSARYVLTCEATRAVPEQGRSFPPWGNRALAGDAWRPLKIGPETRCQAAETDDPLVLERSFLAMVLDQATALLTAREVTRVDDAEALLKQALLLTRPAEHESAALAQQRSDRHKDIERLLGDVAYWRAASKVRDAAAALGDAARQYDAALAQHPLHVTDAAAWAAHARRLAQQLHAGPAGASSSAFPPASPASPTSPASPSSPASPAATASSTSPSPTGAAAASTAPDSSTSTGSASPPATPVAGNTTPPAGAPPAATDTPPEHPASPRAAGAQAIEPGKVPVPQTAPPPAPSGGVLL